MPYGCANEKTLAVMYVLDGEVMLNVLPSYFEKIIKTETKYTQEKNSPVPCHDQQQIHLLYLLKPSLRSPLDQEKVNGSLEDIL